MANHGSISRPYGTEMGQGRTVNESLSNLIVHKGMSLHSKDNRTIELRLSDPIGQGTMTGYVLSPNLVACFVDFRCGECPNMTPEPQDKQGHREQEPRERRGEWFSINYCLEGRCETDIPHVGTAVVGEGDVCISFAHTPDGERHLPRTFRYPLARYVGIEVFVNTRIVRDPSFSILNEAAHDVGAAWAQAGYSAIFSDEKSLISQLKRCLASARTADWGQAKLAAIELLWTLARQDYGSATPQTLLAPAQLRMAKAAHDQIEAAPTKPHDARTIAAEMGVSATTLNEYFAKVYGMTIARYTRRRRIEIARNALERGEQVAAAACAAGYSNPSKFSAAFKRETGVLPSQWSRGQSPVPHT